MITLLNRFRPRNAIARAPKCLPNLIKEVRMSSKSKNVGETIVKKEACGDLSEEPDEDEMEEMFVDGPAGMEWGGPTRGGARPEPTRFGDWERKGRVSDF